MCLRHVNFIYGLGSGQECTALQDINLDIADGEFTYIIGKVGCGKSSLLKSM
ncbi:MAG: ATP-binding cassette domain-containing protein, partial [Lachnospiraceae bacterium]|nr:ATP-binding cassette domain-containing protein [Lachnospiraceae bacterium]